MSALSLSSPVMSDKTLLLSVEDLISIAMGPQEGNTVNFKMIQTILHILARQMRMLEQKVVLVVGDLPERRGRSSRISKYGDDGGYRRRTLPEFETEEERIAWEKEEDERERRGTSVKSKLQLKRRKSRAPSANDDGRDGGHGGRDKSGGAGGRRSSVGSDDYDRKGGRKSRNQDRDDDDRGGRGRSGGGRGGHDRDGDREGHGRSGNRSDDDERGGRGRSGARGGQDRDDAERGGRGRSGARGGQDRDDDDRGGRGRSGARGGQDRDDDDRGGRGRSGARGGQDRDDDERGGRGRSGARGGQDRDDDERGGRGRSGARGGQDRDDDEQGGRDRSRGRGGHDKYGDEVEPGGHDRAGGKRGGSDKDDDDRGGRGRPGGGGGRDRDDSDERGGRDKSGGRHGGRDKDDDGRGGHDKSGGRGGDRYDDDERHDRAGGRGGHPRSDEERGHDRAGGHGRGERSSDEERGRGRGGPEGGRDKHGGPGGRGGREDAEHGGRQGIGVREVDGPGKEKLLLVEKGSTTARTERDRDSIAVVTQSQFQLLEEQVDELWRAAGPLPQLTMPDNQQLRKDLAAGASLTDAMQAMQVSARVQAAEQAIGKLGGLLTQLAASGALPEDAAGAVMAGGWMGDEEGSTGSAYKSIRVDPSPKGGLGQAGKAGGAPGSSKTSVSAAAYISKPEMRTALVKFREEVTKNLQAQIDRAATAADTAEKTAKTVGDKVEELLKMDSRLNSMHSMVEDYSEQLYGFDAGLETQMSSFKEQMTTMRAELAEGLQQLDTSNSNPETAAVMELNERFEGLVRGLDDTLLQHTALDNMQQQLTQELKTLEEGVEMLREQKADRDELLDILRDKADITMLEGLVRQEEFDRAQAGLEQRLDKCNDKFKMQDIVWMEAIKDLRELADTKAQLTELMKVRDEATVQLRAIDDRIDQLSLILGEPKAAMLMRKLARDAVCAACLVPALMEPGEAPTPPALPAARGPSLEPPCPPEPKAPDYPDFRTHHCHRWVGGSHTLLPVARAHPAAMDVPYFGRKYTGYGDDGRLYWMEAEMEACVECNPEPPPAPAPPGTARSGAGGGAGDCEC